MGPPVAKPEGLGDTADHTAMDLLERNTQIEELSRHLRDAGTVAGKVVLVSGEAGGGKRGLVEEFTHGVDGNSRLLWGDCDALQTSRGLGPVKEMGSGPL